jgi:small subunit ribosomal protein S21
MPSVERHNNESFDQMFRRFRKKVVRSKVLTMVKRKRWHVSDSEMRRMQRKKAIRRHNRKRRENS